MWKRDIRVDKETAELVRENSMSCSNNAKLHSPPKVEQSSIQNT